MNANQLLDAIGQVKSEYILAANEPVPVRRVSPRRVVVFAAAAAAALLLAGCAAVVAMTLKDREVRQVEVTQRFDAYGETVPETKRNLTVASIAGYKGSPAQLAAQEWNEFDSTYEPQLPPGNVVDNPDIPNNFEYTYSCRDTTMMSKIVEIADKYGLEILGERAVAQRWHRDLALSWLGIENLVRPDTPAESTVGAIWMSPPHNFEADVQLTLTGENAPWSKECYAEFSYYQKGWLDTRASFVYDPETCQEWEHVSPDGTKLLLALWGKNGIILAEKEQASIAVEVDFDWLNTFLEPGQEPTPAALEAVADCFDFSIETSELAMEGLQAKLDAIPDPNAIDPSLWEEPSWGGFADYVNEVRFPQNKSYAFYDLDGDGQEELLIGRGDGTYTYSVTIRDGKAQEFMQTDQFRICEDGVFDMMDTSWIPGEEWHQYFRLGDPNPETYGGYNWEVLEWITNRGGGGWTRIEGKAREKTPLTEEEARAAMAKYKPVELNWQPLLNFPMGDGATLGDRIAAEGTPTEAELKTFYANNIPEHWSGEPYQYYALRDVNEDGITDCLLSLDGKTVTVATWLRGQCDTLIRDEILCEGNVFKSVASSEDLQYGKQEQLMFHHIQKGDRYEYLGVLTHNLSTGKWNNGFTDGPEITEAEAEAFLAKYPEVDPGFRPISELK